MFANDANFTCAVVNERIKNDVSPKFIFEKFTTRILESINTNFSNNDEYVLLVGLLRHLDYCASAGIPVEHDNNFLLAALDKFFAANNFAENPLQRFCRRNSERNIIAIAPTGSGKTEAALMWLGNRKGFFVLPLRTAITAMYRRLKANFAVADADNKIGLLHSGTLSVYAEEDANEQPCDFARQTKMLTLPVTISTPDQLFSFVFRGQQYENIFAVLSYSTIIIDEIQSYSADLLAFIIYGLAKIQNMGAKIAIVTATLPPIVLDYLKAAMPEADFTTKKFPPIDAAPRHFLHVEDAELSVAPIVQNFVAKPKRILVICNTVRKAQEIFTALRKTDENLPLKLLHSRFIKKDRREKEHAIQIDDGQPVIWITTSLVEASLDIDYDCLFTELSDLAGLFQRLGRCNRRGKIVPTAPNCFVYLQTNPKILQSRDNSTFGFIDKTIHELSRDALIKFIDDDKIMTERDKIKLIDNTLTTANIENSYFAETYIGAMSEAENPLPDCFNGHGHFRNISSTTIIPCIVYEENRALIDESLTQLKKLRNQPFKKFMRDVISVENNIMQFTVDVPNYYVPRKKGIASNVACPLELNKSGNNTKSHKLDKIFVLDCDYDNELGFRAKRSKSNNAEQNSDIDDCFL